MRLIHSKENGSCDCCQINSPKWEVRGFIDPSEDESEDLMGESYVPNNQISLCNECYEVNGDSYLDRVKLG